MHTCFAFFYGLYEAKGITDYCSVSLWPMIAPFQGTSWVGACSGSPVVQKACLDGSNAHDWKHAFPKEENM